MTFDNPIVAGDVLVVPAIRSSNYVFGVSGWLLSYDGHAEFSSILAGLVRVIGSVAGGGTDDYVDVLLGNIYMHPNDNASTTQYNRSFVSTNDTGAGYEIRVGTQHVHFSTTEVATTKPMVAYDPVAGYPTLETWHAVSFQNGWSNFGSPYNNCQYRLNALGQVEMRGLMQGGTITTGTTVFTLPAAYRPSGQKLFKMQDGNPNQPNAFLLVQTNGACTIGGITAGTAGFSLEQVTFAL